METLKPILSKTIVFVASISLLSTAAMAADQKGLPPGGKVVVPPNEQDYFKIESVVLPKDEVLEVGAMASISDTRMVIGTRRGELWLVDNIVNDDITKVSLKRYAQGLHEPLGMSYHNGKLYVVQRPEVTRVTDLDGDDRADLFETITDDWGINGNYHEYAFGSAWDDENRLFVTLCLTGSAGSDSFLRGWTVAVTEDGKMEPITTGVRSPGGTGRDAAGNIYYSDNQGLWNGSSSIKHLVPGSFQGNPVGLKWFDQSGMAETNRPLASIDGTRVDTERQRNPLFVPPAIVQPHGRLGRSPAGIIHDASGGKFGPFSGQLIVTDVTFSSLFRCSLEKVNGVMQGAAFPMLHGFSSGNVGLTQVSDGSLYVGGTDRGWGSSGSKRFALERVRWTGKTPFEIHSMNLKPDGFLLNFTKPVEKASAEDIQSYKMKAWTYILQSGYGSPEVDQVTPVIKSAVVSEDALSVHLSIEGLTKGHVHHLETTGVRSLDGEPVLHKEAYYTLNEFIDGVAPPTATATPAISDPVQSTAE